MRDNTRVYIGALTRLGQAKKAQQGYSVGRLPMGYRKDETGRVVIDPIHGPRVQRIFELAANWEGSFLGLVRKVAEGAIFPRWGSQSAIQPFRSC